MHESVVTLQELIDDDQSTSRAISEQLEQAKTQGVILLNTAYLGEQLRMRTTRSSQLGDLIEEYTEANRLGKSAEAAYKLILIQFAAAMIIEAKNAQARNGLD
ncbi:hypothetical protein [Nonomuraea aurantiaca]|uniref:hypothetical protein n=1 Tax=Nonomuraea aurantiaca TaxID=2878562 RepID=UPI001CD9E37D|nr:hypothetical protein [Nonomuraea aurantiaca]MCA2229615.1 hypothetical protein [Nonomuraea aurantiaca]